MNERMRIENAMLLDASGGQHKTSLLIGDGQILAMGDAARGADAERIVDAAGDLLVPGFIDLACHLREPGPDVKGTLASETRAAARGGFTTVCAMPDTSPVNDSGAVTSLIRDLAERQGATRVLPIGAMTRGLNGELLSDMAGLQRAGCVALSNAEGGVINARVLRRCMAYARTFDIPLFLRPENKALAADGCAHEGAMATRLGLPGIPEVAETTAVSELVLLAEETGARLHLSQISCARSVELLRWARDRGLPVTADVAMHHLVFTDAVLNGFDSRFHCRPPLRSARDRDALREAVRDGVISAIVSQHQPQDAAAKHAPFGETAPGLSTAEIILPLGLTLVEAGVLSLAQLFSALTRGPAQVLAQEAPRVAVGAPADLVLVAQGQPWQVTSDALISVGKHSPALGMTLPGRVRLTLCGGRITWDDARGGAM